MASDIEIELEMFLYKLENLYSSLLLTCVSAL